MDKDKMLNEIIVPVLQYLDMDSDSARNLLLGTFAQESAMGKHVEQVGGGPALGIGQMEPRTHDDIWQNYLAYRPALAQKINQLLVSGHSKLDQLKWNSAYATAMSRVHYHRVAEPLPEAHDITGLAQYWKDHYNKGGKGEVDQFLANYLYHIGVSAP